MPLKPNGPRCTRIKLNGERCKLPPIKGGTVCRSHGGAAPQVRRKAAERLAEQRAREAVAAMGKTVASPVDPLDVLDETLAEVVALKTRLGAVVARIEDEALRYRGRAGEQLRGELQAYQAALRDTTRCAETIVKLGLDERRVRVSEIQVGMMAQAIRAVLDDVGLDERQRAIAATSLPRHLRALEAGPAAVTEQEQRRPVYVGKRRPAEVADL